MEQTITVTLNGKEVSAIQGESILEIARRAHVYIPTLCHNDALEPYAACRVCLVEIEQRGRKRLVTSCNFYPDDGLIINTDTERVVSTRNVILELLMARASGNREIQKLADRLGVGGTRFKKIGDDCILCGMCVRACSEVVGVDAIGFQNRGISRMPTTPYMDPSESCIGCGSCVYVCPTGYITMEDKDDTRYIKNWKVELKLVACKECGEYFCTERLVQFMKEKKGLSDAYTDVCECCR